MKSTNYKPFSKYCFAVLRKAARCCLLVMILVMVMNGQTQSRKYSGSQKEAQRIWELAIRAKGGREKLHGIYNMVVTWGAKGIRNTIIQAGRGIRKSNRYDSSVNYFYVFPNKWWRWVDYRPSKLGLSMSMENFETRKKYIVNAGGYAGDWKVEPLEADKTYNNLETMVSLFLETKWTQPKIERLFRDEVGRSRVDVVQTMVGKNRMDFMFDKKTHLLLRVVSYNGEKISGSARFSEYTNENGIKMASKVTSESEFGNSTQYRKYQFNVEYNEEIFEKPPLPVEDAADAWKKGWKNGVNR